MSKAQRILLPHMVQKPAGLFALLVFLLALLSSTIIRKSVLPWPLEFLGILGAFLSICTLLAALALRSVLSKRMLYLMLMGISVLIFIVLEIKYVKTVDNFENRPQFRYLIGYNITSEGQKIRERVDDVGPVVDIKKVGKDNIAKIYGNSYWITYWIYIVAYMGILSGLVLTLGGITVGHHEPYDAVKISILFVAADPSNRSRLRLGEEFRQIAQTIQSAKLREKFRLELPQMSARPEDLSQALLDKEPRIVHFSGHGKSTGALCFENSTGTAHPVLPDALAALFQQFRRQVDCVVLNACYSEIQAKAIAEHINYVVGMKAGIPDQTAISFTGGFYQALGSGRTIEEAYQFGCVRIRLLGIPEHFMPVLVQKEALPH